MTVSIIRPSTRILTIGSGVRIVQPGGGGGATVWYLPSGVAAANCKVAYAPKGAADLATSYSNLASPGTYDAAPGTAPTFDTTTGWTFNGSTQWLDTGYKPANSTITFMVRFSNANTALFWRVVLGTRTTNYDIALFSPAGGGGPFHAYINGHYEGPYVAGGVAAGVMGMAKIVAYLNGVADGTQANPLQAAAYSFAVGAKNGATPDSFFSGKVQAVAIYNVQLTPTQAAALSTAMAAL